MKQCTGCGRYDNEPLGININGDSYLACCPDNNYITMTSMRAFIEKYGVEMKEKGVFVDNWQSWLDDEKEQIINAHNNAVISPYTDLYVLKIQGKSPITKGEEYYNQTFKQNKLL